MPMILNGFKRDIERLCVVVETFKATIAWNLDEYDKVKKPKAVVYIFYLRQ